MSNRCTILTFELSKIISAVGYVMIMVGERSGTTDDLLNELAVYYNEEIDQTLKNIPLLLEHYYFSRCSCGRLAISIMPMYSPQVINMF